MERSSKKTEIGGRKLVEQIPAVIYVLEFGEPSSIVYCSPHIEYMLGYSPETYEETGFWIRALHPEDREQVLAEGIRVGSTEETFEMEYRCIARDGRTVWIYDRALVQKDDEGRPRYRQGIMLDITVRKAFEEQLVNRAFYEPLTGLPNRLLFTDRLEQALARTDRRERPVFVLFLDLDNFKLVNDNFGHDVGDQLLVAFADRLRDCVRPEDTVARMGGDEFTVLLEDVTDTAGAVRVADRIIEEHQTPFTLDEREISINVSIGIASSVTARNRPSNLLKNADLALYEAKRNGKTRYEVFEEMRRRSSKKLSTLGEDLGLALDREELTVYYQPKVALESGDIVGVEALVRWMHPERGLILPATLIPLAEKTGLMVPIGEWVLREACEQVVGWRRHYPGSPLTLSVNLSTQQMQEPHLVEEVSKTLRDTRLEPARLILELSEQTAMDGKEFTKLGELKSLGLQLEIDDFGTSYFSLPYLESLPINTLKVDCAFVWGAGRSYHGKAIISAAVGLARALDRRIVAESVETTEQLTYLKKLSFSQAQGNYFASPSPSSEISALLAAPLS